MEKLTVKLHSLDNKVKFGATARNNPQIVTDYFPPIGTEQGYAPLELLMISFASCTCTALLTLLRNRKRKVVDGISVELEGIVREEAPKIVERMNMILNIKASDLTEQEVREMLQVAEEQVCPVWAMIKGNVEVEVAVRIG